jgi:hypothetical protein
MNWSIQFNIPINLRKKRKTEHLWLYLCPLFLFPSEIENSPNQPPSQQVGISSNIYSHTRKRRRTPFTIWLSVSAVQDVSLNNVNKFSTICCRWLLLEAEWKNIYSKRFSLSLFNTFRFVSNIEIPFCTVVSFCPIYPAIFTYTSQAIVSFVKESFARLRLGDGCCAHW